MRKNLKIYVVIDYLVYLAVSAQASVSTSVYVGGPALVAKVLTLLQETPISLTIYST